MSGTMKEALVYHPLRVEIHNTDALPTPGPDQVLTKVVVSGSNPKDWKVPAFLAVANGSNSGDDIAGTVVSVGANVREFKPGDRVAAFHEMRTPHGSFAELAISPAHTTFHIPASTSFEEAATIPLAAMTAAVGLYSRLGLPEPWVSRAHPDKLPKGGIIIYGAASAVGAYAVKLAVRSNIHPIIAVAGNGIPFVESLLDRAKGDVVLDYRKGNDALIAALNTAVGSEKPKYAFDCVSEKGKASFDNIGHVLDPNGYLTLVLPGTKVDGAVPASVKVSHTMVGSVFGADREFGYAWFRLFGQGLQDGWFSGHPYEVVPGGLGGVEKGLTNLKEGRVSATKFVFRIAETEGLAGRKGEEAKL